MGEVVAMNDSIKVGLIGLGAMGSPMATHLDDRGLLSVVGNRTLAKALAIAEQLSTLKEHGESISPANIAADFSDCDVVVLCVSKDSDVLENVITLSGVLKAGAVVVDHSTVSMDTALQSQKILAEKNIGFIDAPVSGGVEGARNGKLSVMVGGTEENLEKIRPVLNAYAAKITHMGGTGAGQATKAVNQVLVAGIAQAVCEGLALGEKLGLDPEKLVPTLAAGAAGNWFLDKRGATMMANNFTPGFKSALLHKDLLIVREMAVKAGIRATVIEQSLKDYAELMQQGFADEDTSALIRLKRAL
jgi:3-hydroxyisobutyrate dehydrogenase